MDRSLLLLHSLVELPTAQLVGTVPHVLNLISTQRLLQIQAAAATAAGADGESKRREAQIVLTERWWKKIESLLEAKSGAAAAAATTTPKRSASSSAAASTGGVDDASCRWAGVALFGASVCDASAAAIKSRNGAWIRALKAILTAPIADASTELRVAAIEAFRSLLVRAYAWSDTRQLMFDPLKWLFTQILQIAGAEATAAATAAATASGKKVSKSASAGTPSFFIGLSHEHWLSVLRVLIDIFAVYKQSVKNAVPRFADARVLVSLLDHHHPSVRALAVRASALLVQALNVPLGHSADPTVIAARADRVNHWSESITLIVQTLHTLFEDASAAATADHSIVPIGVESAAGADEKKPLTLMFDPLPLNDSMSRSAVIARRFSSLCALVCELLNGPMDADNKVPIASLLALIDRVVRCEVSAGAMKTFTGTQLSALAFASLLPGMHESALDVLHVCLAVLRQHLLSYAGSICGVIMEVFRATAYDARVSGFVLPALRCKAYTVFAAMTQLFGAGVWRWCSTSGVLVHAVHDACVPLQLRKARQIASQTTPSASTSSGGGGGLSSPSPKKSAKMSDENFISFASPASSGSSSAASATAVLQELDSQDVGAEWCDSVGVSACNAVLSVLQSIGALLSTDLRILIDTALVSSLLAVSTPTGYLLTSVPSSYRLALYHCLLASLQSPQSNDPAVLSYCVRLFSAGSHDPALSIAAFCNSALATCQLITQPRAPPLSVAANSSSVDGGVSTLNPAFVKHLHALIGMSTQHAILHAAAHTQSESQSQAASSAPSPAAAAAIADLAAAQWTVAASPAPAVAAVAVPSKPVATTTAAAAAAAAVAAPIAAAAPVATAAAANGGKTKSTKSNSKRKASTAAAAAAAEPKLKSSKSIAAPAIPPPPSPAVEPTPSPVAHVSTVIDSVVADSDAAAASGSSTAAADAASADGAGLVADAAPDDDSSLWSL